jgi:hypothetical protein
MKYFFKEYLSNFTFQFFFKKTELPFNNYRMKNEPVKSLFYRPRLRSSNICFFYKQQRHRFIILIDIESRI